MYARELERNAPQDWMRGFAAAIAHCLDNLVGVIQGMGVPRS